MDRLKQMLGKITELSDTEIDELRGLILATSDEMNADPSRVHGADSFEELEILASAATDVRNEVKRREDNVIRAHEAEQVLASFRTEPQIRPSAAVPSDRLPRFSSGGSARALTASGMELHDHSGVVHEFASAFNSFRGSRGADGDKIRVATLHVDRGASRTLASNDSEAVTAALAMAAEQHVSALAQTLGEPKAITAAGGLGAFPDTDYTLPGFESTARPVKGSLPNFTSDRGGVRYMRPPTLATLNGSVGIWTVENDVDARTNVNVRKPSLRVLPGTEVVVNIQAVTTLLTFGNLMSRAYPEFVQRVLDMAMAAHAVIAEQQLLTQIGSLSTTVSGADSDLGATRILLPLLDRAATGMRNRLRMPADAPLQLILPDWARGMLRSDLAMQEPGDATVGVTDAELATYLAARHLSPTWSMDGEAGQQFSAQSPGAVNDWPSSVVSYMFPAGAFQFLDGGSLDLGIVRDSTLNAANDFMTFTETFEAVLFRGGEAFRISQAVTPSGIARAAETAA